MTNQTQVKQVYYNYITHIYSRKTGELLYSLSGTNTLTEKEAIQIQIDLSTSEKIFMLEQEKEVKS